MDDAMQKMRAEMGAEATLAVAHGSLDAAAVVVHWIQRVKHKGGDGTDDADHDEIDAAMNSWWWMKNEKAWVLRAWISCWGRMPTSSWRVMHSR